MGFGEPIFLFGFLPAILLLYWLCPAGLRNLLLLAGSLLFYGWGEPVFLLVALGSALLDLLVVRAMLARPGPRWRRFWVSLGVALNLGLLAWYKYAGFLHAELSGVLGTWLPLPAFVAPLLPVAVSFIVFEKITYIVDVYRGHGPRARLDRYLLYVFLFPKLLAGPILQYHDLAPQMARRPLLQHDIVVGLLRFTIGLGKKVLIADSLAVIVDEAFGRPAGAMETWYAWLALLAFAMQLYFDFSGYSDMAIGLARCFGFKLRENFLRPFLAESMRDFWQRWHISLTRFIRDYLYAALRGRRRDPRRTYLNLWIAFLATGLWHGASWNFILWGALHGCYLTLERQGGGRLLRRLPRAGRIAVTFTLAMLSMVLFRSPTLEGAGQYYAALAGFDGRIDYLALPRDGLAALLVALAIVFLPGFPAIDRLIRRWPVERARPLALLAALLLLVFTAGKAMTVAFHPFLYFRF